MEDYLSQVDSGMFTVTLGGLGTALLLYYLLKRRDGSKYPPGPIALPLIGNLPQLLLSGSIDAFAEKYRKTFGDIFTLEFGGNKRIVVSGFEAFQEILIKNADDSSTRSRNSMPKTIRESTEHAPGLLWAVYPHWKTLRSFTISTLREEGMGKAALEPQVMEEIHQFTQHFIEPNLGQPMPLTRILPLATANMISQMLFAKRSDYDDERFTKLVFAVSERTQLLMKIAMIGDLPFGKYLIKSAMKRERSLFKDIIQPTLQSYIDEHKESVDRDHPRDLIDRYLIHSKTATDERDSLYSDGNALILSVQLHLAGTDTTSTALSWAFLFLCLNPDVNLRVQQEIKEQIGLDRSAVGKDRMNMPYTDAVLLETMRKANIAALALPHTMSRDITINGVLIPAGADLAFNMASVLHDETVFEEPHKFKPERYLTGDIALKKQRTIPFGIGRRACAGESLARTEFFLFFVTFVQKYEFRLKDGLTVTDKSIGNGLNAPAPYEIVFSRK